MKSLIFSTVLRAAAGEYSARWPAPWKRTDRTPRRSSCAPARGAPLPCRSCRGRSRPSVLSRNSLPVNFFLSHLPGLHRCVGLRHGMRHGQQQRHGVFGHADGVSAGSVHDQDALARGGVEIDVVDAHSGAPMTRRFLARPAASAVTLVALRTSRASASRISSSTLPFVLGRFTTVQEGSAFRISMTLSSGRCPRQEFSLCFQDSVHALRLSQCSLC
jgi:hypothetical protein